MNIQKIILKRKLIYTATIFSSSALVYKFYYKHSGLERFFRTFQVGFFNTIDYKWSLFGMIEDSDHFNHTLKMCHQRCAERMLEGCLKNGGLYVKLGQGLGALNHILPMEYVRTLTQLQDKALHTTYKEVEKVFIEDTGKRPEQIYKSFNKTPFAAASLAQVHEAYSHDDEKFAVKVQYHDLRSRFEGDVKTIEILLSILELIHPTFGFSWILQDLKGTLAKELDFEQEAMNGAMCAQHLKKYKDIHVPKVYKEFSTKRILTFEYIDGVKINDLEKLQSWNINFKWLDKLMVRAFCHQIFQTGFVHGDPHPGNILVRRRRSGRPQLVILDHGLYESMDKVDRQNLAGLINSLINRDFANTQKFSKLLGVEDWQTLGEIVLQHPIDTTDYGRKFKMISSTLTQQDISYMKEMAAEHFDKIMNVLRKLPKPMILFMRNLNLTRSVCKQHGDVINRYVYMSDSAIRARHFDSIRNNWLFGNLFMRWELISFRLVIKFNQYKERTFLFVLKCMNYLGMGPSVEAIEEIYISEIADRALG